MKIAVLQPAEWAHFSEDAFRTVFKAPHNKALDRITFALVGVDEDTDLPVGYLTARELNGEDLCWEYGGAFPDIAESIEVYRGYCLFAERCREMGYARILQVVENTNHRYLKLSMKLGFNIVGVRTIRGETLVEMLLEF